MEYSSSPPFNLLISFLSSSPTPQTFSTLTLSHHHLSLSISIHTTTMKLIKNFPKKLFTISKKSRSNISRSDDPSFGSATMSSFSDSSGSGSGSVSDSIKKPNNNNGQSTPTSVLPSALSNEIISVDEWSLISSSSSDLIQAFCMMDRDGDGKIEKDTLASLLSRVGDEPPSEDEIKNMLNEVDSDGDGCISLEEFGAISSAFGPPAGDSELRDAFDFFDTDHDGKITAEELFNVFKTIGDARCTLEDCRSMIGGVDVNGDGFVCFDDFSRMMELQR